ncbi:shikimate dehydrogenase family protein [Rickettsiales endosymbiont of Stachyamoeba lipophora]|uniref:shikimate dehydrogenase family protein n=1 Tax=Rickettsiales endosymbiont of Stachyamoeba lipophora TaxID=2486578 RepID=UPI000F64592A|nr:shikimate dehydrogenase [Rickettsiales endosymbiont of Stachyamoeba lipophora]AZL15707.1 shikimate dehydrogenase [Rickettsiales endosymbiont of Stachyamoeba lipophora]
MNKNFAIIGYPLDYTLSPLIHNYWFELYNLPYNYLKLPLISNQPIAELKRTINSHLLGGFNITVPFKQSFINDVQLATSSLNKIGAINTVKINQYSNLLGYNTDYLGFMQNLKLKKFNVKGKAALIIGAGGVARAIIQALLDLEISEIYIANRSLTRVSELQQTFPQVNLYHQGLNLEQIALVINATSLVTLADYPIHINFSELSKDSLIYDVVYKPYTTELIQKAQEYSLNYIEGIELLLAQAQHSFEIWFDIFPTITNELLSKIGKFSVHPKSQ